MNNQLIIVEEKINLSRGYTHFRVLDRIGALYLVLDSNFEDMKKAYEVESSEAIILRNKQRQTLFNFLSSTYAYGEQLKVLVNSYYGGEKLETEYTKKVEELSHDGLYSFVKYFRNYHTHSIIPLLYTSIEPDGRMRYYVGKNKLYEFKTWSRASRDFFESFREDQIEVLPIFDEYMSKVKTFVEWLVEEIISDYDSEIEEYLKLVDRHNRITGNFKDFKNRWKKGERNLEIMLYSELQRKMQNNVEYSYQIGLGKDY